MLANKRGGGDLAGSSNENKRARSFLSGDLYSYANEGIWSELGEKLALKLSKSVVSLALSDGHSVLFSFSGIVIRKLWRGYRFLTSASLVRALKEHDDLKIEVRHEQNVAVGFLEEYDLDHEIAVVKINSPSLNLNTVFLRDLARYQPYYDVVSLGRDTSGKLLATTGKLTHISIGSDRQHVMFSSCKLSEIMEGGPLFGSCGGFVGMNLVTSMEKSFFLPAHLISERLMHFETSEQRAVFLARVNELKLERVGGTHRGIPDSQPEVAPGKDHYQNFDVLGYPRPIKSGMNLVNTFEEPFGDIYPNGVWEQFVRGVSEKIHDSVVALASFKGDKRFFACSGTFIDWDGKFEDKGCQIILTSACLVRNPDYPNDEGNKIVDGLTIKVMLPGRKRRKGTLIHYSLHYNVALVRVKISSAVSLPVVRQAREEDLCSKLVVAVGRCFKSGDLMASSGKLAPTWSGPFDFKRLLYCTCRIKKAGIGGPLVDAEGSYIGMNFYDRRVGNPFLSCDDIVDILVRCKKGTAADLDNDSLHPNRWPVPWPKWLPPGHLNGIKEHERRILDSGCPYNYSGGDIFILK